VSAGGGHSPDGGRMAKELYYLAPDLIRWRQRWPCREATIHGGDARNALPDAHQPGH